MTTLPVWAVYAVGVGTPVLSFLGVLVAQYILRRGATELEARSRREETMRNLRWAAELSVSVDDRMATLGVAQLEALLESDLLDQAEQGFVEAALDVVYDDAEAALERLEDDAEAVRYLDDPDPSRRLGAPPAESDAVASDHDSSGRCADG